MNNHLITSGIAILLICIGLSGCVGINEEEFRVTVLNTVDEKMWVECYIFQDSEYGYNMTSRSSSLEPNESYAFHFKYDKSYNVYEVAIRGVNYTY